MPNNQNNSNWTGRTPRSLNEAFGPYDTFETDPPKNIGLHAGMVLLILSAVIVIGLNMGGLS